MTQSPFTSIRRVFSVPVVTLSGGGLPHPISVRHADVSTAYRSADQMYRRYAYLRAHGVESLTAYMVARQIAPVFAVRGSRMSNPELADRVTGEAGEGFVIEKSADAARSRVWYPRQSGEHEFCWCDTRALSVL